jgi:hypothetical protein
VVSLSRVAALAKDYGHYLRTAPCCETPQQRWIRNYQIEGLLAPGHILYSFSGHVLLLVQV